MTLKFFATLCAAGLFAAGLNAAADEVKRAGSAAASANSVLHKKHHLIMQMSEADPTRWNLVLNNARNAIQELGKDNVDIEIVAYGPGIGMLKADSEVGNRLAEAASDGVKLVACENTMKGQKLVRADMHAAASFVPAGVVELILKQEQGYAYIRP